jgi:hypothetical protein
MSRYDSAEQWERWHSGYLALVDTWRTVLVAVERVNPKRPRLTQAEYQALAAVVDAESVDAETNRLARREAARSKI